MKKIFFLLLIALATSCKTSNPKIPFGDLLSAYAKKPRNLEFVKCEKIEENQVLVRATYRVQGDKSKLVEDFLIENYKMGKLKWVCCGWESTNGKNGQFEHSEFQKIDPYCSAIISMYGSGEIEDENKNVSLEFDRNKIDYFTVVVELVIV